MSDRLTVGGQAVIEGVMMRGPGVTATAVRTPEGRIEVEKKNINSISDRFPVLKKPFLRGTVALIESLVIGIRSLSYSAKMAGEEDEQLSDKEMAGTIIFALVLASILFIAIPTGAAKLFHGVTDDPVFLNLMEGALRLLIFLAYIWGISRMKDIRRVFQYHGAEHKTIRCYEAKLPLTVENVRPMTRFHPRCGTSFLFVIMILSILLFTILSEVLLLIFPGLSVLRTEKKLLYNLLMLVIKIVIMLPLVVSVGYEFNRVVGRHDNWLTRALTAPGLWLQRLTTNEPDDSMIEVAIEALTLVIPEKEGADKW